MQELNKFKVPKQFRGRPGWYIQLWYIVHASIFKMSPQVLYNWRRFLLRIFGARIGKNVKIRPSVKNIFPWKLNVGDNSWIGDDVDLYSLGEIFIGKNVVISQKSYLCTGSHDLLSEDFRIFANAIIIEDQCWIGADVYIAPGVSIGKGTVVGARSSVFNSLPPNMICKGSPAKAIKCRLEDPII